MNETLSCDSHNQQDGNIKDLSILLKGNILKSLIIFALPVLFALFLQAMYGAVDLMVVGKFANTAEQSGVATGSQLLHSITAIISGFAIGITILIGEGIGKNDSLKCSLAISNGIVIFGVISVVFSILIVMLAPLLATFMQAPEDAYNQTVSYIRVCGIGFIFIVAYNVLGAIFRGIGDSKTPLLTVFIACVINILLDFLFVIGFKMGAMGAAVATVIAQGVSVLVSIVIIKNKKLPFKLEKSLFKPQSDYVKRILGIGTPIALQELLVGASFIVLQSIGNSMGLTQSSAIGVAEKVCGFIMLIASSFMQSMAAFVAQNDAAFLHSRSKKALLYGILTALSAGVCTGLLSLFAGDKLAQIFSNDAAVVSGAHEYLKAYAVDCLFTAVLFCMIGYFNGTGRTLLVMIQGIVGAFCIRVPFALIASSLTTSLFVIGLATPCSSVVQIIINLVAFFIIEKQPPKNLHQRT